MKNLRLPLAASVLTFILTTSALAGDMPFGVTKQSGQSQVTVTGDMPLDVAATGALTVTEIALALMQSALLLF